MSVSNIEVKLDKKVNLLNSWTVKLVEKDVPNTNPPPPSPPKPPSDACDHIVSVIVPPNPLPEIILKELDKSIHTISNEYEFYKECVDKGIKIDETDKIKYHWLWEKDGVFNFIPLNAQRLVSKNGERPSLQSVTGTLYLKDSWIQENLDDNSELNIYCFAYIGSVFIVDFSAFKKDKDTTIVYLPIVPAGANLAHLVGSHRYGWTRTTLHKIKYQKLPRYTHTITRCEVGFQKEKLKVQTSFAYNGQPRLYHTKNKMGVYIPRITVVSGRSYDSECNYQYKTNRSPRPIVVGTKDDDALGDNYDAKSYGNRVSYNIGTMLHAPVQSFINDYYKPWTFLDYKTNKVLTIPRRIDYIDNLRKNNRLEILYLFTNEMAATEGFDLAFDVVELYHSMDNINYSLVLSTAKEGSFGYSLTPTTALLYGVEGYYAISNKRYLTDPNQYPAFPDGYYKIRSKGVVGLEFISDFDNTRPNSMYLKNMIFSDFSNIVHIVDGVVV